MLGWLLRVVLALGVGLAIYLIGAALIRSFTHAAPAEPDPDNLEPVSAEFECVVCGARVTMTAAQAGEEIEAPRHCKEDMVRVDVAG